MYAGISSIANVQLVYHIQTQDIQKAIHCLQLYLKHNKTNSTK
jgi:stress-induced morphogen